MNAFDFHETTPGFAVYIGTRTTKYKQYRTLGQIKLIRFGIEGDRHGDWHRMNTLLYIKRVN
jgi:hypothetical protein